MMIDKLLSACDTRYMTAQSGEPCEACSYTDYCPHDCERCLDFIHTPDHAPDDAPGRKYDCTRMADFYVCKYVYRYTSEMIYALRRLKGLRSRKIIKVLSFGCGPCTDLLALEYLQGQGEYGFTNIEYRGVDYSMDVWKDIHTDLVSFSPNGVSAKFYYQDVCHFIDKISEGSWIPDLVTFQYFLSDLHKHSKIKAVKNFLNTFAQFVNTYMSANSYIILNDANFGVSYGGGREYFDTMFTLLENCSNRKGRFHNEHSRSPYYPRGYTYGEDCDGEFLCNRNIFDTTGLVRYSPFDTCASAQMLIKKEVK